MDLDANQLKTLVRHDEQAAAIQLIERFYERIYAFLRRLAGNDADAADLTQRTFGRVWQALPSFAGRSSPASWLHGIAHHVYVDWRRRNYRTEPRSDEWWAACPATEILPDEAAARADLRTDFYLGRGSTGAGTARLDPSPLLPGTHFAGNRRRHGGGSQHRQVSPAPGDGRVADNFDQANRSNFESRT